MEGGAGSFNDHTKKIGVYQFFTSNPSKNRVIFLNFNGCSYEKDTKGINSGIGIRQMYKQVVFGINVYHDFQIDGCRLNQLGIGLELFSSTLRLYGNIYLPFGKRVSEKKEFIFDDYIGDYQVSCLEKTAAVKAFEVNISKVFFRKRLFKSSLSFGVYGFDFYHCKKFIGTRGGVRFDLSDYIYLEPQVSHDQLSGTQCGFRVGIAFPLNAVGSPKELYRPVSRQVGITSKSFCSYQTNY